MVLQHQTNTHTHARARARENTHMHTWTHALTNKNACTHKHTQVSCVTIVFLNVCKRVYVCVKFNESAFLNFSQNHGNIESEYTHLFSLSLVLSLKLCPLIRMHNSSVAIVTQVAGIERVKEDQAQDPNKVIWLVSVEFFLILADPHTPVITWSILQHFCQKSNAGFSFQNCTWVLCLTHAIFLSPSLNYSQTLCIVPGPRVGKNICWKQFRVVEIRR